jgi:DNA-binding transcriptional regulator YiaG
VGLKIAKTEVIELTKTAEEFNAKLLDFIEKLNADEINRFREKFRLGIASSHR